MSNLAEAQTRVNQERAGAEMKIVVLAKHVPDATGERSFAADGTVDRSATRRIAVRASTSTPWSRPCRSPTSVTTSRSSSMTLGPEDAADAIKRSLQMGASAGIHIIDDAVHGSDALATSRMLAEAVKKAALGPGRSAAWPRPTAPWAWFRP